MMNGNIFYSASIGTVNRRLLFDDNTDYKNFRFYAPSSLSELSFGVYCDKKSNNRGEYINFIIKSEDQKVHLVYSNDSTTKDIVLG